MKIKMTISPSGGNCNHILLDFNDKIVVTTKTELMNGRLLDLGDLKENIFFNDLKQTIQDSNQTEWDQIKILVEAKEFKFT